MKNKIQVLLVCLILLMNVGAMGCGAKYFIVDQAPSRPFNSFSQIEVKEFQIEIKNFKDLSPEEKTEAQKFTAELSVKIKNRLFFDKGFFTSKTGEKLIIEGRTVEFNPGSRAVRWLIGFGAGEGKITVLISFISQDGTIVAKGIAGGGVTIGKLGGDMEEAIERLVEVITDFVEKNYQE